MQVKERCQKGIPPSLRGRAWLYLTGGKVKREQNRGRFQVSDTFEVAALSIFQKGNNLEPYYMYVKYRCMT